jgi:hypothetical protein
VQLHRARQEFEDAGARLVLIGQSTPQRAAEFRRSQDVELPILADEQRVSYRAIGARKGSVGELIGPKMVARGLVASARLRVHQGRTIGSPSQLGAAMVIGPGDQISFKHLAQDSSDNATPEQLLDAVRRLG